MSKETLWQLRRQIRFGSTKVENYRNTFGIDPKKVYDFFQGFYGFIRRKAKKNPYCKTFLDAKVFYDNRVQLWEYHGICKNPIAF